MSKNFELMQQSELLGATTVAVPEMAGLQGGQFAGVTSTASKGHAKRLNASSVASEESLRLVQTVFLAANAPRVVMFAGIDTGNGCSHICAQAADMLAINVPGTVCLVDGNLRRPSLPEFFGVSNHHGLTDSLRNSGAIREFAKKLRRDNLWLLSSGSLASDSSVLLNSELLKTRIAELRKEFDYVLIDSPALSRYSDGMAFGQLVDGLILVLEANATRREAALKVAENLRAAQIKILGAVLNKRTFPIPTPLYNLL
jgi:capsular exopolysaccharide synthesis family protein